MDAIKLTLWQRRAGWVAVLVGGLGVGIAGGLAGCSVDVTGGLTIPDDIGVAAPAVVTIRFRNFSVDTAVNVEFHATNDPLETLPDDLLVPENLWTASVGVAGTGIIQPLGVDEIEFPCTDNLTIGTAGGTFLDNDTGDVVGIGTTRWVGEGQLGLCGSLVTFDFSRRADQFTTDLRISN